MMKNITDSLNIKENWATLAFDKALKVIVKGAFNFGSEADFEGRRLSLSNWKLMGKCSRLRSFTISLFLPLINRGPKLTFPTSMKTLGSITVPTTKKYSIIFWEGISNTQ